MPNHTMFPKHSERKEIRVRSCHSFVSAFREKGFHFYLPLPAGGSSTQKGTGCLTVFLLMVRENQMFLIFLSLCVCGGGEWREEVIR